MALVSLSRFRGIERDVEMPTLGAALDPAEVQRALAEAVPALAAEARLPLPSIHVVTYRPGRRCVIEYDLASARGTTTILGTICGRGCAGLEHARLATLWGSGFSDRAADGISVPEPLGTIPRLAMWLQRKVPGRRPDPLSGAEGASVGVRVADAIRKLQATPIPEGPPHTMEDELVRVAIALDQVAALRPDLRHPASRLLDACARAAAWLRAPGWCGAHRALDADHVRVDGSRLYLLGFEQYGSADPGFDAACFAADAIVEALRAHGVADAAATVERTLEDRLATLAGDAVRPAIRLYTALKLVRRAETSARMEPRSPLAETLVYTAAHRVATVLANGGHN
jgi:hypothetical protein